MLWIIGKNEYLQKWCILIVSSSFLSMIISVLFVCIFFFKKLAGILSGIVLNLYLGQFG